MCAFNWLLHLFAVLKAIVLQAELALVCEIFIVMAHPFSDTTQDDCAGGGKRDFQKDISAVVRKIKASTGIHIVRAEVHPAFVDDEQELQCIDQTGLARVVGGNHRDCSIQRQLGTSVASTVE
jgi:hypothetical protein